MGKIYFTVEEAEKLLPQVDKKIEKLMDLQEEISIMDNFRVEYKDDSIENNILILELNKNYHSKLSEFYKELEELARMGAIVKDLNNGIVDFYSKYEDKDILLCWKFEEKKIAFWHEANKGYDSRKPVTILKAEIAEKLKRLR